MSSSTITKSATPTTRCNFFSLPYEIRLDIYERHLYGHYHGFIGDDTMIAPWASSEAITLLEVSKKVYEEASPLVYQSMHNLTSRYSIRAIPGSVLFIRSLDTIMLPYSYFAERLCS
ncbi:hypothetical protein F4805DRAFT_472342 [Annulohypoxylon moriforme]|nr:hypothetical protein F4805DRAFT_472342 [Annulohypoxylon moriforme]